MAGERSEQATPQRRDKARRDGDLLHSRELCTAAGTLAGTMLLRAAGPRFVSNWSGSLSRFMKFGSLADWEPTRIDQTMRSLAGLTIEVMAPVGLVAAGVSAAALSAGMLQTGGIQFHPKLIGFRPDRINPLSNVKNLFSLRSTSRLGKSMVPAGLLAVFALTRISHQRDMPPFSIARLESLGTDLYQILMAASWLLFCWALIDYLVEWRSRETRLKMSRQEMRDEYKESEGNPQIRGRIRNLQRQARHRRMKADVAKAAVVVTNPTHYAVALGFDFVTMEAPKVLAKGRNLLAEEIKEQARWAGVPILENPPLARSLYRSVETGDEIPAVLYAAVASILAFLYRQRVQQEIRERQQRNGAAHGRKWEAGNPPGAPDSGPLPNAVIPGIGRRPSTAKSGMSGRTESPSPPGERAGEGKEKTDGGGEQDETPSGESKPSRIGEARPGSTERGTILRRRAKRLAPSV